MYQTPGSEGEEGVGGQRPEAGINHPPAARDTEAPREEEGKEEITPSLHHSITPSSQYPVPDPRPPTSSQDRLRPLSLRGNVLVRGLIGASVSFLGLILLTGMTPSPWLFLLYPLLIGGLLFSLALIGLHLLRRFDA